MTVLFSLPTLSPHLFGQKAKPTSLLICTGTQCTPKSNHEPLRNKSRPLTLCQPARLWQQKTTCFSVSVYGNCVVRRLDSLRSTDFTPSTCSALLCSQHVTSKQGVIYKHGALLRRTVKDVIERSGQEAYRCVCKIPQVYLYNRVYYNTWRYSGVAACWIEEIARDCFEKGLVIK